MEFLEVCFIIVSAIELNDPFKTNATRICRRISIPSLSVFKRIRHGLERADAQQEEDGHEHR